MLDSGHPSSSSSSEDDDDENIDLQPHKVVNMDSCPEHGPVKAFVDDEAEEEDDSDHDLMRFQENEEDDESDDDDVVNDLIATDFKEAPIDHESRNLLHQKWVEQQDTAATDNFLQRLRCGQKQKEPKFFHEEEENEEFSEKSEEEESYDLPRTNATRKNAKLAKQMVAQMYTDDQDAYVSSDDEEIERALTRQRLLRQNVSFYSLLCLYVWYLIAVLTGTPQEHINFAESFKSYSICLVHCCCFSLSIY